MLTPITDTDDRRRAPRGLVLSIALKQDQTLRLSIDRVDADGGTLPNGWDFKVFQGHFAIDQTYLQAVEREANKPGSRQAPGGIGVPESVLLSIGRAILVPLIADAVAAREAGPL